MVTSAERLRRLLALVPYVAARRVVGLAETAATFEHLRGSDNSTTEETGEQSDKPLISTFLATEGIPELLRVPDVAGSTAGRGSVPSYPAVEAAVRALARVVEYTAWLEEPHGELVPPERVDEAAARRLVTRVLGEAPKGRDLTFSELRALLASYDIDLWDRIEWHGLRLDERPDRYREATNSM